MSLRFSERVMLSSAILHEMCYLLSFIQQMSLGHLPVPGTADTGRNRKDQDLTVLRGSCKQIINRLPSP